jgi:hypothetical protein
MAAGQAAKAKLAAANGLVSGPLRALMVWVRARMAVARATRRQRIISTWPVPALGRTVTSPACTALAAARASRGSDLPGGVGLGGRVG